MKGVQQRNSPRLHAGGEVDELAGGQVAVAGDVVPDAAVYPRRIVVAICIHGAASGLNDLVVCVGRGYEVFFQGLTVPGRIALGNGELLLARWVFVADADGACAVAKAADVITQWVM